MFKVADVVPSEMRTVLMALVVLWWCHLAVVLPVILGQQARDNLDRKNEQGKSGNLQLYSYIIKSV